MEYDELLQRDFKEIESSFLPWDNLKGKRIFCTGATGFIGKYLVKFLCWLNEQRELGLELFLFCRPNSLRSLSGSNIHWIEGNITDEFIPEYLSADIILHMASPANWKDILLCPSELVDANIIATRYLLEYTRKIGTSLVFFSSGVVGRNIGERILELDSHMLADPKLNLSLYGASKMAGELLCDKYRQEYNIDCRIIRPFTIYGPGESLNSTRYFTDFLRQFLSDKKIVVSGTGKPIRDFCYISDFVSGLLYVLLKGESTVYNIGNEDNVCSILELAHQIAEFSPEGKVIGPLGKTEATAGDIYVPNTSKLRTLGWVPKVSLEECIRRCLESCTGIGRESK